MTVDFDALRAVLDAAHLQGAQYADVRYSEDSTEGLSLRNGDVESATGGTQTSFGVRAMCDGAWGFAGTTEHSPTAWHTVLQRAVSIARASARHRPPHGNRLAPEPVHRDDWRHHVRRDPFEVGLPERLELLREAATRMAEAPAVHLTQAGVVMWRERKQFASTEGSEISQEIVKTGANLTAWARGGGDTQRRSFSDFGTAGWEFVDSLDLPRRAGDLGREAGALLDAAACPQGAQDLILGGEMVALQVHESCGHPVELDRVLGSEATFAGTSFLTPECRGRFRYGSMDVNMTADATLAGALGSFGYDDEGVAAQRTQLVERGVFCNYLTSRETAAQLGERSGGTMRAEGALNLPLIRMTNINLEPGDWTLAEMIRDTKHGLFFNTPKSWSLDDKRLNFHFGCEIGYEIVDGALGRMLKNGAYTAMTPDFWGACDAVAGGAEWHVWGTPGCAKGEPVQIAHVGHGAAPARLRRIRAGVGA